MRDMTLSEIATAVAVVPWCITSFTLFSLWCGAYVPLIAADKAYEFITGRRL